MPEVDTSSYNLLKQPSMLDTAGGFAGLQNKFNQIKLFNQQQRAGGALMQGVNPDGSIDSGAQAKALQGANLGAAAPDAINQMQTQQGVNTENYKKAFDLHYQQRGLVLDTLSGLATKKDVSMQDVIGETTKLINAGMITQEQANNYLMGFQTADNKGQLQQALVGALGQTIANHQQYEKMFPNVQGVAGVDANGQPIVTPIKTPSQMTQMQDSVAAPAQNTGAPGQIQETPIQPQGGGSIAAPSAAQPPTDPNPAVPNPVPAPMAQNTDLGKGPVVTGAPAGVIAAAGQSGDEFKADQAAQTDSITRKSTIQKALELLPTITLGNQSDYLNQLKSTLLQIPGMDKATGWTKGVAQFDEFHKYLEQNVAQLGLSGTDAKLLQTTVSNPNVNQQKEALQVLLPNLMATERLKSAQWAAAQGNGIAPAGYSKFKTEFNKNLDPRGFADDLYTPEYRKELLQKMTPEQRTKYANAVSVAVQTGQISDSFYKKAQ